MSNLQSYNEIQTDLAELGEVITIAGTNPAVTFKAMTGFHTQLLQDMTGMNSVIEQQKFNLYCAILDCKNKNIVQNMQFVLTDTVYNYTVQVMQDPIPHMDGWARIPVQFISKVSV